MKANTSTKKKKTKVKQHFVFIVDSYEDGTLRRELEALGLKFGESCDIAGAGGASGIMTDFEGRRDVDAKKLLVVMSTFHGSVEPAIALCEEIKEANPKTRFIFRSNTDRPSNPMFEQCLNKSNEDDRRLIAIVKGFLGK